MKNGSKKFYILGSIVTMILIVCVAVLIGILSIKPNKTNAETTDHYEIVIDRISTVTVYVRGSGVHLYESDHAGGDSHSNVIHDVYRVEKGTQITLTAVNESKIFTNWNIKESDNTTAYNATVDGSTDQSITFTPTKDARVSVSRRDTTTADVGKYMANRFLIDGAKDLYLLQKAFEIGKSATVANATALIYNDSDNTKDVTLIQLYDKLFADDFGWNTSASNADKVSSINSKYFARLQTGYYLISQNFAYLDKDNNMPFTGIGNSKDNAFKGVICGSNNGNISTVSLIIQSTQKANTNYYGLFGYVDSNAVIRNLKIETSIGVSQNSSAQSSTVYAGGLAGYIDNAFLYNVNVTARNSVDLNASTNSSVYAGSIAGYLTGGIEEYANVIANGNEAGWVIQTNHTDTDVYTGLLAGYAENTYVNDLEMKVSGYAVTVKNSTAQGDTFAAYMGNLFGYYNTAQNSKHKLYIRNIRITGDSAEHLTALVNRGNAYVAGLIGCVNTTNEDVLIGNIQFQISNKSVTSKITATSIDANSQANMYTAGLFAEVISDGLTATDELKKGITKLTVDDKTYYRYDFIFNANYQIEAINNGYCNGSNGLTISAGLVAHGLFNINGTVDSKSEILISSEEFNFVIKATQTAISNGVNDTNIVNHCMAGLVFGYIDLAAYTYTFEYIDVYSNGAKVIATRELTSKATGDIHVGGFITYSKFTKYEYINLYLNNTEFRGDSLSYDATLSVDGNSLFVGALIGEVQGNGTSNADFASISHVKVSGFDYINNVETGHTIKMTSIQNTRPIGNDNYNGENYIGGVVGRTSQTNISFVTNNGSTTGEDYIQMQGHQSPDSAFCGGIVGFAQNVNNTNMSLSLEDCKAYNLSVYCSATISKTYNDPDVFAGGILGAVFCENGGNTYSINRCYVENCDINGVGNERIQLSTGGILGYAAWNGTVNINSCYVYGSKISSFYKSTDEHDQGVANSRAGGILGRRNNSTVTINYSAVIDTVIVADGGGMAPLVQTSGITHQGTVTNCYSNANLTATGSRTTTNIYGISPSPTDSFFIRQTAGSSATGGVALDLSNKEINDTAVDLFSDVTDMDNDYKYPAKYYIALDKSDIFKVNVGGSSTIVTMGHDNDNNTSNNAYIFINMLQNGNASSPTTFSDTRKMHEAGWFLFGTVLTYRGTENFGGTISNPIVTYPSGEKEFYYDSENKIFKNKNYPYDEVANTQYENIGYTETTSTTTLNGVTFGNKYVIKVRDDIPQIKFAFSVPNDTSTLTPVFFNSTGSIISLSSEVGSYTFDSTIGTTTTLYELVFTPNTEIEQDTVINIAFKIGSTSNYLSSGFQLDIYANTRVIKYVTYADYTPPVNYHNAVDANGNILGSEANPYYLKNESTTKLIPVFSRVNDLPIDFDGKNPIYPEYNSELNIDYVDYYLSDVVGTMKTSGEFVAGSGSDVDEIVGYVNSSDYSVWPFTYLRTISFTLVSGNIDDIKVYFSTDSPGSNWTEVTSRTNSDKTYTYSVTSGNYRTFRIENTGNTSVTIDNIDITRNGSGGLEEDINTFASRGSGASINGTQVTLSEIKLATGIYYINVALKTDSPENGKKVYFKFVEDVNVTYTSIGSDINGLTYATNDADYVLESTCLDHYGGLPKKFNVTIGSTTYNYTQVMSNGWIKDENDVTLTKWDLERTYYQLLIPKAYITGNISIEIEMDAVYTIKFNLQCDGFNHNYTGPQTLVFKVVANTTFKDFFTTEILNQIKAFEQEAISKISGYLCTGFFLVSEADTEVSYGVKFDELKDVNIPINTTYNFYARWNFLIELVEAPGTSIVSRFQDSFMIEIDNSEYGSYVNRTIAVPINANKGYVFSVEKETGFVGEADVKAYIISNKGSSTQTVSEISIEKYHENMYLYFIAPEKITGYLVIVTSVSNSEVIVGENTAQVTDEVLPEDGIYTFKYVVNHKNTVDENGNPVKSFIYDSGINTEKERNLDLVKDLYIQFFDQNYNTTSKKLELARKTLEPGTIIEVYYNLYINNSTTPTSASIGSYVVSGNSTSSLLLSNFKKINNNQDFITTPQTFREFLGSNEAVSEVYYFVVTPPNGYDKASNKDGYGNIDNDVVFVGYYDPGKDIALKNENYKEFDLYVQGKRTGKSFANKPIQDQQGNFEEFTNETSLQQKIYAMTPSRNTNLTLNSGTYKFEDYTQFNYIDIFMSNKAITNGIIKLEDNSTNNTIIKSGFVEYGINKLSLELGYSIGDVDIYGSYYDQGTASYKEEKVATINVDKIDYNKYEVEFGNKDKLYYYFRIDNVSLSEIRLKEMILTDQYYLREFNISADTYKEVGMEDTFYKYVVKQSIVGDLRHESKQFMLALQFKNSSGTILDIDDSNPIVLNISYVDVNGNTVTATINSNLEASKGKMVVYFDLSKVLNTYNINEFTFTVGGLPTGYSVYCSQLIESSIIEKPAMGEVRVSIK